MSSCASSLMSSRAVEDERTVAAQLAADAILNRRGTDSETSSSRNVNYGSINARAMPIPIDRQYPEIMVGSQIPYYMPISDDIVSGSRLPGGKMS